jgi:hypothetical protein
MLIFNCRTGDLLIEPVHPSNSPFITSYVNTGSQAWFEGSTTYPTGTFEPSCMTLQDLNKAVEDWVKIPFSVPFMAQRSTDFWHGFTPREESLAFEDVRRYYHD